MVAATLAFTVIGAAGAQTPAPRSPSPAPDSVGRLWDPTGVQGRERTKPRDNEALVHAIEGKLRCTCGCNLDVYACRTTDFTCATSPAMHRSVLARLDSALAAGYAEAQAADSVVARFEAQYGQSVLMAPPKRGFNWTAYVTPFVALVAGLAFVAWLMRRWIGSARAGPAPAGAGAAAPEGVTAEAFDRVRRELERFEA